MSTVRTAQTAANRLLRDHLYEYLDEAELHARDADEWRAADIDRARTLIPDLVEVIRTTLAAHRDSDVGECLLCQRCWPCPTVETMHAALTDTRRHFTLMSCEP